MPMKETRIDWQWPASIVYAVTFLVLGGLVALRRIDPSWLIAMLTWLAPSPYLRRPRSIPDPRSTVRLDS